MNISMSCMTTFGVAAGRIVAWSYRGNDCKAKERGLSPTRHIRGTRAVFRVILPGVRQSVAQSAPLGSTAGAVARLKDVQLDRIGGWDGAVVGAKMGAAAGALVGIETGPGTVITGAIGGNYLWCNWLLRW